MQKSAFRAREIVLETKADSALNCELDLTCEVDRAHLVMLAETKIVKLSFAQAVLQEIDHLRACQFAPLRGLRAPRGLFLLYEDYLIERLGPERGGILQTARSRNDLNATVLLLRLRAPYHKLVREALRLQATLLGRGRRFSEVAMPAYTHYQAAVPVTFGHYLIGIASALKRDLDSLIEVSSALQQSPLGAGAVGGTSWPIDSLRTSRLLGFDSPMGHSMDAVASRDAVLRLLAAAAILGVLLSRFATDFLLWSSREFDFIELPEGFVGGSSLMPQKRNAFMLEHVQGKSAASLGALVGAVAAMQSQPFTNSISVGHEAIKPVWAALDRTVEAIIVLRLMVAQVQPRISAMQHRAIAGHVGATELANLLVRTGQMSFRSAHQKVGDCLRHSQDCEGDAVEAAARKLIGREAVLPGDFDPKHIASTCKFGGGAGSTASLAAVLQDRWSMQTRQLADQTSKWKHATYLLERAVRCLCDKPAGAMNS